MEPLIILGLIAEGITGVYLIDYFRNNEENINYQVATFLATMLLFYFTIVG